MKVCFLHSYQAKLILLTKNRCYIELAPLISALGQPQGLSWQATSK